MNRPPGKEGRISKIVVVEDEGIVAQDLAGTLEELGYEVSAILSSGEEAVARIRELRPDLVLMDIRLAGALDGIEAARIIRAELEVSVVFLTAHSDAETLARAKRTMPAGYLVKPFRVPDLVCAVELAIHKDQIERQLRERERWLSTTLRALRDGVVTTNGSAQVTFLNAVASTLTGWSEDDAVGRTIDEIVQLVNERGDAGRAAPALHRALEDRTPSPPADAKLILSREGAMTPVDEAATPILDDSGALLGGVVILRDASERRRHESTVVALNAELERRVVERTQQLEAANRELEAFSYSVAHDLRAPLRGIDGFSQALIEDHTANLGPEALDYLRRVRAGAQRMGHLIDDLLRLSRVARTDIHRDPLDLSVIAADVIAELRAQSPGVQVEVEIAPSLMVDGDARLLRIALGNLIGNAWKFTARSARRRIRVIALERDGRRGCTVEDNGAGFDMARATRLFGAFQRLHASAEFEGTGIGLAIVQRIIHRHGGNIWAEGAVGSGAAFSFVI